jgi:hypothetical protein
MVHTKCLYIPEVSCFSKTFGATISAFPTAYDANFKLMAISYWSENPKQINILEDQGIKGGMRWYGQESFGSGHNLMTGPCEHGNEPSRSIKDEGFLD